MENYNLRSALVGGYRKQDVLQCLEKIQAEFEALKQQTAEQVAAEKEAYTALDAKYQQLLLDNVSLQQECDSFHQNKDLLVQLEIDANARAAAKIESAEKEAAQVVNKAHTDAADLREQYVLKAQKELTAIQRVQAQLAEFTATITEKNNEVQKQMSSLEKLIGETDAPSK